MKLIASITATLVPAMTLTGTLPNATAGEAYTGTLTLGGTFTAPVAIDASAGSIPSWMTPTVSGNTVTFTGTAPASAETDTFTVRATDSSATPQVATSPQSVVVSASSGGGLSVVGSTVGHTLGGSTTIALPPGCAAGDYAVIGVSHLSSTSLTPPSGATELVPDTAFYSTSAYAHVWGYTLTSTDIANGSVPFTASATSNQYALVVLHSDGSTPAADVIGTVASASPNNTQPISIPADGVTTTVPNDLVLAFAFVQLAGGASIAFTTPDGWTLVGASSAAYSYQIAAYSNAQASIGTTGDASITATASVNTRGGGVQIAFKATP